MSRVAVVTGAASGMGLAISRRLADEGSRVALLDLDGDAADQAADDLRGTGAQAIAAKVDVTDRGAVDEALQRVRTELGPVEIMVTSAGLDEFVAFTDITTAQWERMIAVNLTGVFHSVQAAVPDMLAAGWGRIGALRRVEGRGDRSDEGARGRARPARHHREHDPAGLHRHPDDSPSSGHRRPPQHGRDSQDDPGTPDRDPRRRRGDVRVPLLG